VSFAIVTFGCRVNQADSRALEARLRGRWGDPIAPESADLVIVNTCAVTADAERSARQLIRHVARANPRVRIVATGCYATRDQNALAEMPDVTEVWPNTQKDRLLEDDDVAARIPDPGTGARTVLFVRVQTGCAERCAYCGIPGTRGRPRSLAPDTVVSAVSEAAGRGYREVVLTGVHLGAYGRDLRPASSLLELVRSLEAAANPLRLRLSSIEPMDCSQALIEGIAESRQFVPHLHLPLQHGSDAVLTRMRRQYSAESWLGQVREIRRRMPDASIGTDLIVGFPGESPTEFEATLDLVKRAELSYLHPFRYSDRPGTDASSMPDKVPAAVVRRRLTALREVGDQLRRRFASTQVGQVRDAITLRDPTVVLTDNFLKVRIPAGPAPNEQVAVRVTSADPLTGTLVQL